MRRSLNLWLLLLAFVAPIAIAWAMLRFQWYEGGVTNRGNLLPSPVAMSWLQPEQPQWQLVYQQPQACDPLCQGALFNLRQVPQVIGESEQRLQSTLLLGETEAATSAASTELSAAQVKAMTETQQVEWAALPFGAEAIYIVDPLGNIMMAYPLVEGKEAILSQGKDIVRDLKRLLKVSKIG
ncbi:hypothetical protein [Thaumasiovibrio subtropicus]|uniref:hypothetical protein n=1 Tax=Thaumasiovibrio subtropicus TaxID=1891207 RepID=UPI000B357D1D|nr:hypothetical protein [Thaumasiovibrio subtropicus]